MARISVDNDPDTYVTIDEFIVLVNRPEMRVRLAVSALQRANKIPDVRLADDARYTRYRRIDAPVVQQYIDKTF
jgi:hypothetical protein